jgi:multidrug resistance protein
MDHHCHSIVHHLFDVGELPPPSFLERFLTGISPLASSMLAPAVPLIMAEFHEESKIFATFVVSIFVLGFAVGPLTLAPLSEIYGRVPVYNTCNVLFLVFTILCAIAKDSGMILAARFWAGLTGVAVITCGAGTIADLIPVAQRGRAMAIWTMGPLLGPVIGPVAGGFLVEARGWRWVFWVIVILVSTAAERIWPLMLE